MKIAYVSHDSRPNYEYHWFSRMPVEKIKFLDIDFASYPTTKPDNVEYCQVQSQESRLFAGKYHSTAKLVTYTGFERYLADVDVIIVLEVFSSIAKQFTEYAHKHGKKVVVLVYELIPRHPLHYLPSHIGNRLYVIKHADLFVCVSNKARDCVLALGAPPDKAKVVYPGIDLHLFQSVKHSQTNRNLIFVGGLKPHKGIDIFLEVADAVLPKNPDIKMTVIGKGPYADTIKSYVDKYPQFSYLGPLPNEQLPSVLQQHGILVMPCRDMYKYKLKITSEQFGFSFVEAMACGLAVITTDAGALPEIVGADNIVVAQNDSKAVIAAVESLLSEPRHLASVQANNAKRTNKYFDVRQQARALSEVIEQLGGAHA